MKHNKENSFSSDDSSITVIDGIPVLFDKFAFLSERLIVESVDVLKDSGFQFRMPHL